MQGSTGLSSVPNFHAIVINILGSTDPISKSYMYGEC